MKTFQEWLEINHPEIYESWLQDFGRFGWKGWWQLNNNPELRNKFDELLNKMKQAYPNMSQAEMDGIIKSLFSGGNLEVALNTALNDINAYIRSQSFGAGQRAGVIRT